ncbi:N-acetyllactosaminide beta-1,6-N-acetylglucosaminyl-transferase [Bulinus truncatus]|nr:N-acetyllactosaminide beta-1,6-N-acetylglucosaminyl-transferase [Bulinus truncatus]
MVNAGYCTALRYQVQRVILHLTNISSLMISCRRNVVPVLWTLLTVYVIWMFPGLYIMVHKGHHPYQHWCEYDHSPSKHRPCGPVYGHSMSFAYSSQWVGFPDLSHVDCSLVLHGSVKNQELPLTVSRVFPHQLTSLTSDCWSFIARSGFLRYPTVSEEEKDFPLAFTILFYKDIDQIVFLLRAIYRPHNVYCLNVDTKSSVEFLEAVHSVARCFPNVFVASKLESIVYAGFSRLMADINCIKDLLTHPVKWKYVINLPGQQFPLKSNLELVKILKLFNGTNDVEGMTGVRVIPRRHKWRHDYVTNQTSGVIQLVRSKSLNMPPPHGLHIVKGSAYGTFSRGFVNFTIHDPIAKDFLKWCKTVSSPDEYYWATLHHSNVTTVPGGYTGNPDNKTWLSAYASWGGRDPCATTRTRSVCIFSPEDLPHLLQGRKELFANKFYITHHPAGLHCLDQFIFNLTFTGATRDLEYYRSLPFVKDI